jgi:thioredoxin-related protein
VGLLLSGGIDYLCVKIMLVHKQMISLNPKFRAVLAALLLLTGVVAQPALAQKSHKKGEPAAAIKWVSLEEAAVLSQKEPRKIVIDVYTDWCGWCRKMDKSTFTDPAVTSYVNQKFYAVKLNAESRDPITINGKTYKYNEQMRAHEAALALLSGKMSYPTTVYLDETMGILSPVPGYLEAPMFKTILTYFGENHHKQKTFAEYTAAAKVK